MIQMYEFQTLNFIIWFCLHCQALFETTDTDDAHFLHNWIQSLQSKGRRVFSQADEDGVIEEVFNHVGTTNKVYVEFGASDGQECNTRYLRENKNWNIEDSLLLDGGHEDPSINLKKVMFWPSNIVQLFREFRVKTHFDLLSVDMDSYDWFMLERILEAGYKPRVVIIECNVMFDVGDSKSVMPPSDRQPGRMWDGTRYMGASMLAIKRLLNRFSYSLVWCNLLNCIGIQDEVLGSPVRLPVEEVQQHIQWVRPRGIELNLCDKKARPMAIIKPDGTWDQNTDNGQGSQYIRCHEIEYERGKQVPDQLTKNDSILVVKEYMDYLNYTSSSPSSIFEYRQ